MEERNFIQQQCGRYDRKRQSILMAAKIKIRNAQKKQKFYYDHKHCKPGCFDIGSKVLLKDFSRKKRKGGKLDSRWTGPYIIEKNIGKGIYMLSSISNPKLKVKRASACHLKPFKTRPKASSNESHYSRPLSVSSSFDNQSACMESDSMSSKKQFLPVAI